MRNQKNNIVDAVVRPFPAKVAGILLKFEYEMNTGESSFERGNADLAQVYLLFERDSKPPTQQDGAPACERDRDIYALVDRERPTCRRR